MKQTNWVGENVCLRYAEWEQSTGEISRIIDTWTVAASYSFICKLVDATVIANRLWEHTSNESEGSTKSTIYVRPWSGEVVSEYRAAIEHTLFHGACDVAEPFEVEWQMWQRDTGQFACSIKSKPPHSLDVASLLLDHYSEVDGISVDILYTVLDADRNKLLLFVQMHEQ
ncbi:hypothetical protein [Paenibacillus sp. 481]|uniref:hypothetical protein n=1 Tax=Paenibacillus sp. 481 TaxID=2835869 RepID=UPI001E5AB523|nr:hypothetical protein [Paenibacillus sp. 481]UHA72825.1 hypothetical protein KIK04_19690 [Paenibacillus sp. 481]